MQNLSLHLISSNFLRSTIKMESLHIFDADMVALAKPV